MICCQVARCSEQIAPHALRLTVCYDSNTSQVVSLLRCSRLSATSALEASFIFIFVYRSWSKEPLSPLSCLLHSISIFKGRHKRIHFRKTLVTGSGSILEYDRLLIVS
jgi:hypothetical protein